MEKFQNIRYLNYVKREIGNFVNKLRKLRCVCEILHDLYAPGGNKGQSQGHKVIDLDVIWKGIISGVCMPNLKSLSLAFQKLEQKVKVDNRQTDKQTNRNNKKHLPPIIRLGGMKNIYYSGGSRGSTAGGA